MSDDIRVAEFAPSRRLWRLPSWLLNQAAARANRLVAGQFGRPGLRSSYAVLAGLDEFGPISQAELGRRLGIDRSDMVTLLNDLERDGLAQRTPDENDRRRNAIRITDAGTAAMRAFDGRVEAAQDEFLAPLTVAERAQLVGLLHRLLEHHAGYRAEAG
ncbi:MarR family winged helix-turn-helix transcriptional regulator [Pseudonocardia sp. GCM10023141]|uniref:MarR family winged helix-turn-helix transcriptional regulator n=1 Tax=Pseudonocardia sp. GCM10023141 TaxID=3252653 RepID=UPI0036126D5C